MSGDEPRLVIRKVFSEMYDDMKRLKFWAGVLAGKYPLTIINSPPYTLSAKNFLSIMITHRKEQVP
jgi:hypothetical protein